MSRLQNFYKETVVPELVKQFDYKNIMEVPRITKVTLNMGVGEAVADRKVMDHASFASGDLHTGFLDGQEKTHGRCIGNDKGDNRRGNHSFDKYFR